MTWTEFFQKALSESNGQPSSTRIGNIFALIQWSIAVTIGFFTVLIHFPDLIVPYFVTLSGLIAASLGISAFRKKHEPESIDPLKMKK